MNLNETKQINLKATVVPSTAANKTVTWSSSNSNVATVDSNGLVVAKSSGTTTITASTSSGKIAACKVVVETLVTSIKLDKTIISLNPKENNKAKLNATVYPSNATNKNVKWVSSNTNIATVDASGNIVAYKPGKVTITAYCGKVKASCVVTIMHSKGLFTKYDSASGLNYWIYIPDGSAIEDLSKIPLIIFLHGNGEIGKDLSVLKTNNTMVKLLSYDTSFNKYGAIIIAPQATDSSWSWAWQYPRLKILADNVVAEYGINKDKISITGFSGGAIGCWRFALKYPDFISCVVPVAGYTPNYSGEGNLHKKASLWCIVGERDGYSRPNMEALYNNFKKYDNTAKLTIVPGIGHNCYVPYRDYNVIDWMAKQTRK